MGHKTWTENFDTEEEAEQGARKSLLHAIPGYSERYVQRGPFQYKTADGRLRWMIQMEEYYG